jgi:type II secretory pathway pseudopilin PulG
MNHSRRNVAFTLIEMLAATAAASILLVGVLGVIALLSRDRARLVKVDQESGPALGRIMDLMRQDLINARSYRQDPKGQWLVLNGYGAIDSTTLTASGRPAEVTYLVRRDAGGASCLLRRQLPLDDDHGGTKPFEELVAQRIARIHIAPAPPPDAPQNESDPAAAAKLEARGVPQLVRLEIDGEAGVINNVSTVLVLH